ncbi:DUF1740-domain-containing protein [Parathielavia hyrcaniae]|uniref:DUF1740-domain-containing protein n=1 Tax=Parathielavia hyrcaniae TaxID=113614 RepID=A0AAN6QAL7_9PEZI|nr:DUF1740-domain-containing protein [Parathielavia hyrcaniae]
MEDGKGSENEKRRRAVPKFASFKPSPTPTPETAPDRPRSTSQEARTRREGNRNAEEQRRADDRRDDGRRRHGRESGRERDHDRFYDRARDRHRSRDREVEWNRERPRDLERDRHRHRDRHRDGRGRRSPRPSPSREQDDQKHPPAPSNDLFVLDKRGDPLILQFGTNDRSLVPTYHRFGAGKIIGTPGFLTIHRDTSREHFSIRAPGEGSGSTSAFRDKTLVAAANRAKSRRIKPSPAQPSAPPQDFIPLEPSSRKRKRGSETPEPHPPPPNYRSIHITNPKSHTSPPSSPSSPSSQSTSHSRSNSPELKPELTTTQTRASALSSHLKSHPTDADAWLSLISLQDALFAENRPGLASCWTADEFRALAELKMGLYEEALEHVADPARREVLVLGMMGVGKRWEEVLLGEEKKVRGAGGLDFEMGRVGSFSVDQVRGLVTEKLAALGEVLAEMAGAGGGEEEEVLMRLLWDAGFGELAVAAWQGMLEMTFCRPMGESTAEAAMESFGEFWESEVARIGEEGARGWKHFVESGPDAADPPEPRLESAGEVPQAADLFRAWAAAEQQATSRALMPARTLDEGNDDDPFRVVMFSDIKDGLVWFPPAVLSRVKPLLADAFLVFCGLPPAGLSGERFAGLGLDLGLNKVDAGAALGLSRRTPEFRQQGNSMAISPEVLFSGDSWFRYLDKWSNTYQSGDSQVEMSWALRTLGYLVNDGGMETLAEYYLAMAWLNEPAGAKKVAKGLLKRYSSNTRLYNAYALVERANQDLEVSLKVLSSATGLVQPSTPSDSQLLWNTWAWIHLESGQKEMALVRLCSSVDRDLHYSAVSPALLLKARSHLSSTRDYSLSSQQLETAAQYAESLMLMEYLASEEPGTEPAAETQGNITAALSTIHSFSRELQSRNLIKSPDHERLLQTAARLLYYHATHGPYRPSYLASQLQTFIALFPRNTIFLSLLAWSQPSPRINDPVRTTLDSLSLLPAQDSLSTRRFAIQHEARFGTAHSVRAAFEAALQGSGGSSDPACRASVELWMAYVRFCCCCGSAGMEGLRGRAKEVYYRAIGACPWAKEVYMLAFGPGLAGELGGLELGAVVETMVARGLRVHVDLGGVRFRPMTFS